MQNAAKRNVWQMGCTDADVTGRCQHGARMHGAAQMFAWQVRTDQLIRTVIYMQRPPRPARFKQQAGGELVPHTVLTLQAPLTGDCAFLNT